MMLSLPETLFIASYLNLSWVTITANIYTRLGSDGDYNERTKIKRSNLQLISKIILICLIGWLIIQGVIYFMLFLGFITPVAIVLQQCILSLVTAFVVIIGFIKVQVNYSGLPYRNNQYMRLMRTANFVTIIWTLGRITHGMLYIIRGQDLEEESSDLGKLSLNNVAPTVVFIIDLITTELLCFYLILDSSFYRIFSYEESIAASLPLINKSGAPYPYGESSTISYYENQKSSAIELNLGIIDESDIITQEIISEKPCKLGKIYKGSVKEIPVAVRRLAFPRTNKYVYENIKEDIQKLTELECPHFMPIRAAAIYENTIDLITQYLPNGSLYAALHEKQMLLTFSDKLRIAREIAISLRFLHREGWFHGHLSSHNILLDSEWNTLVCDVGLIHLKKYAGLVKNYSNKGSWSSPEQLKEGNPVVVKPQVSDDSYSFGMIL